MLYIRKGRTPELVKEKSQDIKDTPGNDFNKLKLPDDVQQLRKMFDSMPKKEIREAL